MGAGHSQNYVDRAGQEPGQHALGSGRASQLGAVAVQRVSAGQVGFEQGSQVGDPPTTIGRAERQLEVEFGEPVLRAQLAQRPTIGERAKRSGQGLHQSIRQRHGVEPGERESCCLPRQLPAQRPGQITVGGIDTLQHRVHQAAELRAARQWGQRRGGHPNSAEIGRLEESGRLAGDGERCRLGTVGRQLGLVGFDAEWARNLAVHSSGQPGVRGPNPFPVDVVAEGASGQDLLRSLGAGGPLPDRLGQPVRLDQGQVAEGTRRQPRSRQWRKRGFRCRAVPLRVAQQPM